MPTTAPWPITGPPTQALRFCPNRPMTTSKDPGDPSYRAMLTQVTVDKLADMIIWLDEHGRYVFVNPATTRLLGYSADELSRMHVWDVDPHFDEARWRAHWAEVVARKSFRLETVNRSRAGVDIPIEVTVNLVEHEGRRFNCSIVRDITERKRCEAELRALNDRIYRLSVTDALTGLANRRHFDIQLDAESRRQLQWARPLSLVLADVDAFKAFNDAHGHVEGDTVLQRVAGALQAAVSVPGATVARYGGEEFACILPGTTHEQALAVAEQARQAVQALGLAHAQSAVAPHVTASLGVLTVQGTQPRSPDELLRLADRALYRAKREGRNRVVGECVGA